jgi:hypothetical protein
MEQRIRQCANGTHDQIGADPLLRDPDNGDFRLTANSPAIDNGKDMSAFGIIQDFDGVSRLKGSGWDIGAFVYE